MLKFLLRKTASLQARWTNTADYIDLSDTHMDEKYPLPQYYADHSVTPNVLSYSENSLLVACIQYLIYIKDKNRVADLDWVEVDENIFKLFQQKKTRGHALAPWYGVCNINMLIGHFSMLTTRLKDSSSSSSAFPSYISSVHHFGWAFCVCDCFFLIQPLR